MVIHFIIKEPAMVVLFISDIIYSPTISVPVYMLTLCSFSMNAFHVSRNAFS